MSKPMPNFEAQDLHQEDLLSAPTPKKKRSSSGFVRFLIFVVFFAIIGVTINSLIKEYSAKTFPDLPSGSYWGKIAQGISDIDSGTVLYFERADDKDLINLSFVNLNTSKRVEIPLDYSTIQSDGAFPAVTVNIEGKNIKLSGQRGQIHDYEGIITDASTGELGAWYLNSIFIREVEPQQEEETSLLLSLIAKNHLIREQRDTLQEELERSKADAVMITSYAAGESEGSTLINDKIKTIEDDISKTKNQIRILEQQAANLESNVSLSRKVSPRGRLVALTREILERDRRWASSLQRNAQTSESLLRQQYQEALVIKDLLAQISELESQLWDEEPAIEGFQSPAVPGDDVYWLNYE